MCIGIYTAIAAAVVCRVGHEYSFGLPLAYEVVANLTVADWALFVAMALAVVVQWVWQSKAKGAPVADAAPAVLRRRKTRAALAPGTDPVSLELEACLARAAAGESRAPFQLLGALHTAGVLRPAHVARVLSAAPNDAQIMNALKFAELTKVVLDNDAIVAIITGLCEMDEGDVALEVWRSVKDREYYMPVECLEALLLVATQHQAYAETLELFEQIKCIASPSVQAYAAAIFARGSSGDVAACLNLYDQLQADQPADPSPAWNSLLVSLVRNGCSGRAAQLFAEGRDKMKVLPAVSHAVHI